MITDDQNSEKYLYRLHIPYMHEECYKFKQYVHITGVQLQDMCVDVHMWVCPPEGNYFCKISVFFNDMKAISNVKGEMFTNTIPISEKFILLNWDYTPTPFNINFLM